jgi:hypothetical protein
MKHEQGNWVSYCDRLGLSGDDKIDLHFGPRDRNVASYDEAMADVEQLIRHSLRKAQENGRPYVMFIHGQSTSRPGRTTARSVVRGFRNCRQIGLKWTPNLGPIDQLDSELFATDGADSRIADLANGTPVVAKRIFGDHFASPLDGNRWFIDDGRPLFGESKTIRQ